MIETRKRPLNEVRDDELAEEVEIRAIERFNREAAKELLQNWCINISENMSLARQSKSIYTYISENKRYNPRVRKNAVVIGAAPNLSDDDILKLDDKNIDIIVTNKNFQRVYELGFAPSWVCLIDAHPISSLQFDWLDNELKSAKLIEEIKFLVSTTVYPKTLWQIWEHSDDVYMFNPYTDFGGDVNLSQTWKWMNDCDVFQHGGSVGGLAITLANILGYEKIGLLGFGLCEKGNPEWTIDDARGRDHIYYPDTNEYVSLPQHFKSYLAYMMEVVRNSKSIYYNLSDSPVLRHSPMLRQSNVSKFVEECK